MQGKTVKLVDVNNNSNLNKLNELLKKTGSDKSVSKEDTTDIFSDANKNNSQTVETNIFSNAFLNVFAKENSENLEDIEQEYLRFWEEVAAADGDAETISAEDLDVLFTQNEEQTDKTSAPSNNAEKTESGGDKTKEEEINKELDDTSIAVLNEIAAKYTDRTDLTEEDYEHILAIDQVSQNFYSLYGQYQNELSTEGWIDNVYDGLKDLFGGITREMVQEEFDNYFEQIDAMTKILNGETEGAQDLIFNELKRKLEDESNFEKVQDYLVEYCGSEEKALEVVNNWLKNNTDKINNETFMSSATEYIAVMEDGEIVIKEMQNGNEYFSLTFKDAAHDLNSVFHPYHIVKDNEEVKNLAPSDFNSVWKFYNGVEYNPDKIEEVTQKGYEFTQINIGLSTAYNMEQKLKDTTPEDAFDIFKEQYNGDEDSAIEAFNKYYSSVFDELGKDKYTDLFDNKLTQIRAQKNEKGEIELIARFESSDSEDNSSLFCYGMLYDGESDFCELNLNFSDEDEFENPAKSMHIGIANDIFWQINNKVAKDQLLQNRYKASFKEANNGYTVEESLQDYANLRTEAFGNGKLEKMLNEYISDMDSYSQKLSTIMAIGGIGLSFVCPAFGYVAMAGVFVDNAIDGINMATNEKQGEDWQSLVQNTFKEAAFMAIGMGINVTAQSAHNALTKILLAGGKSAKMAATAGTALEVGIDGALSVGFDVLATGSLNLSGNSIGLLMDIVSGIRGYKAICAHRAAAADTVDVAGTAAKNSDLEYSALKKYGLSENNARSISENGSYAKAKALMDRGVDSAYIKDISKLGSEQFDKCLKLIDDGISPTSAKQVSKLSDVEIDRAIMLKSQGVPDYNLADTAVLKGETAARVDSLLSDGTVSKYYVDKFASLADDTYDAAVALVKSGKYNAPEALDAVSGKNFDLDSALASGSVKPKNEITPEIEKILANEATKLYSEYGLHINEVSDSADSLFSTAKGENGKLTAREKGLDSSLKKLQRQYENGKLKITTDQDPAAITKACREALADAYGTRLQIDNLSSGQAKQIVENSGIKYDDFVKEIQASIKSGNTDNLSPESLKAINTLKEVHSKDAVDSIIAAMTDKTNPLRLTELNNYGDEMSAYFTATQLREIAEKSKLVSGSPLDIVSKAEADTVYIQQKVGFGADGKPKEITVLVDNNGNEIAVLTDKGAQKGSGYASSQMNTVYKFGNGDDGFGELQVRGRELNEFADKEHIPYDIRQGKITAKDTEYSEIYDLIKNMSSESFDTYNDYLKSVYNSLRMKELGITEISVPDISGTFTFKNGDVIPTDLMNKLSYESLLKFH